MEHRERREFSPGSAAKPLHCSLDHKRDQGCDRPFGLSGCERYLRPRHRISSGCNPYSDAHARDRWSDRKPRGIGVDLAPPFTAVSAMEAPRDQRTGKAVRAAAGALAILTLVLVGLETWTHPMVHPTGPPPVHSSGN